MTRVKQGEEGADQQRIRLQTVYEDDGHRFMVAIEGKLKLHKTDLIAGLRQITEKIQELLREDIAREEAEERKKTRLVDASGAPLSSGQRPKLVTP